MSDTVLVALGNIDRSDGVGVNGSIGEAFGTASGVQSPKMARAPLSSLLALPMEVSRPRNCTFPLWGVLATPTAPFSFCRRRRLAPARELQECMKPNPIA